MDDLINSDVHNEITLIWYKFVVTIIGCSLSHFEGCLDPSFSLVVILEKGTKMNTTLLW